MLRLPPTVLANSTEAEDELVSFASDHDKVDEMSERKEPPVILVVEDELLIRMMVADTLADAGFSAAEAPNGKVAMELIESLDQPFQAVILDVGLPDINGEQLVQKIRAVKPDMPIIMTTGYDITDLSRRFAEDVKTRVLAKPYQPEMLETILKEWGL